jgi:hypothetical protein
VGSIVEEREESKVTEEPLSFVFCPTWRLAAAPVVEVREMLDKEEETAARAPLPSIRSVSVDEGTPEVDIEEPSAISRLPFDAKITSPAVRRGASSVRLPVLTTTLVPSLVSDRWPPMRRLAAFHELRRLALIEAVEPLGGEPAWMAIGESEEMSIDAPRPPAVLGERTRPSSERLVFP